MTPIRQPKPSGVPARRSPLWLLFFCLRLARSRKGHFDGASTAVVSTLSTNSERYALTPTPRSCSLLTVVNREDARYAYILAIAGYFSLFPLLFDPDLFIPRYSLYMSYVAMLYGQLYRVFPGFRGFHVLEWLYVLGFLAIPLYEHLLAHMLGWHRRLPFLPLLLTSVYSAVGVLYFFGATTCTP